MALGPGVAVDWITGDPIDPTARPHGRTRTRDEARYQRALNLQAALADETGHAVTDTIRTLLAERLTYLVERDEQCQAYLKILSRIGQEVALGRHAAEALMSQTLGLRPEMPTT